MSDIVTQQALGVLILLSTGICTDMKDSDDNDPESHVHVCVPIFALFGGDQTLLYCNSYFHYSEDGVRLE